MASALVVCCAVATFWQIVRDTSDESQTAPLAKGGVEVKPGDTEIERGTSLIVSAKFADIRSDVKLTRAGTGAGPDAG